MLIAFLAAAAVGMSVADDTVTLKLMSEGAMAKIGYYAPQRIDLKAEKPAAVKTMPEGLSAPAWGVIKIAGEKTSEYLVLADEPADKPFRLWVDSNGNGDLTDDSPAKWEGKEQGEGENKRTMYSGSAMVDLGAGAAAHPVNLSFYRFDKNDPRRAELKDVIMYYRDYAAEGEATLGGKKYAVLLNDDMATGDFRGKELTPETEERGSGINLMIDVNGNGKFDKRGEVFDVRKPFNIGGTTYELADIARNGLTFKVAKSSKHVEEVAMAPDHQVGKKIMGFAAKSTDGKPVKFPEDYKGKVVMLDFWATWCGPCIAEVPGLVKVYNKFHGQGFEVLGISLDNEKSIEKLRPMTTEKGMTWTQVCDGKGWKAEIAQKYVVEGIPACWLVDGDTGLIIATENDLRGEKLEATVAAALAKKKAGTN